MYIYSIACGCYSDYEEIFICRDDYIEEEKFNEIVISIMEKLKIKHDQGCYINHPTEVIKILLACHGFKSLAYTQCYLYSYHANMDKPSTITITTEKEL